MAFAKLCLLAPFVLPATAQADVDDKAITEQICRTEYNRAPECTRRQRQRINAHFGLPPLEALYRRQRKGDDVIVASTIFKLGGGLAMVFQKNRSGTPYAEIRRAPFDGFRPKPLRLALSEVTWRAIAVKLQTIDTNLYDDDRICVGGAGFTLQTIDHLGTFRARMGDVCGEHQGNWLFDELAEIALAELPVCSRLAPQGQGEAWAGSKLYDCFMLRGDQRAAAAAYNFLEEASFWSTWNRDETATRALLADNLRFRWPGRLLPGSGSDFARDLSVEFFEPFRLVATSYTGEPNGSVTVRGRIKVRNEKVDGPEYRAFGTFRSVWVEHAGYGFRLSNFSADRS